MSGEKISRSASLSLGEMAAFRLENVPNTLIRLGNPGDGACLFYSFLHSYCGKNFIEKSQRHAEKDVALFRKKLSEYLTLDSFKELKLSQKADFTFEYYFRIAFEKTELENKDALFTQLSNNQTTFRSMPVDAIKTALGEPLASTYEQIISDAYQIFKKNLKTYREWADSPEIGYLQELFDVNILVLDLDGFFRGDLQQDNGKPCILVYYMNDNHYESIGIAKKDDSGNTKVFFSFHFQDDAIVALFERTRQHREQQEIERALQL